MAHAHAGARRLTATGGRMGREPVLVARDVWASPPGAATAAVRGVSLELGGGEWVALAGPNGCGKSTLALALAGLWTVARGSVTWHGAALVPTAAGRAAARIATVLQDPSSQVFERTVADEIAFTARNLGATAEECEAGVREWAERFALEPLLGCDPHTLSAGTQQRVLLAAALAGRPAALVADEPTAHMDDASREQALAVIRAEASRGLTVLWVTQDPRECAAADRLVRLGTGEAPGTGDVAPEPAASRSSEFSASSQVLRVLIDPPAPGATGAMIRLEAPLELELCAGSPVAFTGPNGSGKTVLLEAIAGVRLNSQVRVVATAGGPGPVLAAQYPDLQVFGSTVAEELTWAAGERGGDPGHALERATQLFAELSLDRELLSRSTWALSAGERRLVQIVAALVTPASAVLVDEPTCGLDPDRAARLGQVLGGFAQAIPLAVATQDAALPARIHASLRSLGADAGMRQVPTEKRIDRNISRT